MLFFTVFCVVAVEVPEMFTAPEMFPPLFGKRALLLQVEVLLEKFARGTTRLLKETSELLVDAMTPFIKVRFGALMSRSNIPGLSNDTVG